MHDGPDHEYSAIDSEHTSSIDPPPQAVDPVTAFAPARSKSLRLIAGFFIVIGTVGLAVWAWSLYCDSRYTSHLSRISSGFTIDRFKSGAPDYSFDKTDNARDFALLDLEESETFKLLAQVAPIDKPFTGLRAELHGEAVSDNYVEPFDCRFKIGDTSHTATLRKDGVNYIFELSDLVIDKPVTVEMMVGAQKGFFVAHKGIKTLELTLSGLRSDGCAPLTITRQINMHKGGRGAFEGWQ